jgi:NADH dehydrogenase
MGATARETTPPHGRPFYDWAWLLALTLLLAGCGRATPHLLTLKGLEPLTVEQGDDWTLTGDGFVERATAHLVFAGKVSRVGQETTTVSISAETVARAQGTLQLGVDDALVTQFLGPDEAVRHATFRGSLSVAFAPRNAGAPPVMGVLDEVVIDLFRGDPTPNPEEASARLVQRFGWQLAPNPDGEMCVKALREGGEPGPLVVGDCALRFGDVNVFGVQDFAPIAFAHHMPLVIRRDGALAPQRVELDVSDLQPPNPGLWRWALGLVGILVLIVLACTTPLATALAVIENGMRSRFRASRARPERQARHWGLAPFLVVSLAFGAAHTGLLRQVRDFDLLLVYCGALPLLWLAQLVRGEGERWSLRHGLGAMFGSSALCASSALALCIPVLHNASLSLRQASLLQGPSPLGFFGFSSPGAYLGAIALLLSALLVLLTGQTPARGTSPSARLRGHIARTLAETHSFALLGLFIVLFAGGWQLPDAWRGPSPWRELTVFQLKLSFVYVLLVSVRLRVPALSEALLRPIYWRWLLPLAVVGAVSHLVWVAGQWPVWLHSATAIALSLGTLGLLALTLGRLYRPARPEPAVATVNPWL